MKIMKLTSCSMSKSGGADIPPYTEWVFFWYFSRSFAVCFSKRATSALNGKAMLLFGFLINFNFFNYKNLL